LEFLPLSVSVVNKGRVTSSHFISDCNVVLKPVLMVYNSERVKSQYKTHEHVTYQVKTWEVQVKWWAKSFSMEQIKLYWQV